MKSKKQEFKKKKIAIVNPSARGFKHYYWMPIVCISLALLPFIPVFTADFVNWDDTEYVTNNLTIQTLSNFSEIVTARVQEITIRSRCLPWHAIMPFQVKMLLRIML